MSAPDPNCEECGGTGMVEVELKDPHPPRFERCRCALHGDVRQNCERSLRGLWSEPPVQSSPLLNKEGNSLWITADQTFLAHLRHVVIRMPTTWRCKVVTDADLTTSWLASIAIQGQEIFDADARKASTRYLTLADLALPPDLLVIRMGVKVTRNQAAPETLAEALRLREHEGKPTWVWDQPSHPLNSGHLFWSDQVGSTLRFWKRLGLKELGGERKSVQRGKPAAKRPAKTIRKSLRG